MNERERKRQQAEIRKLNAERRALKAAEASIAEATTPKRLTMSRMVELLLTRHTRDLSHVGLTRNAKGDTQIEVVCYAGDELTVDDACDKARGLYDALRMLYPMSTAPTPITDPKRPGRGR